MPVIPSFPSLFARSKPLDSPLSSHYLRTRNAAPPRSAYIPGAGAYNPRDINNKGFFALFALLGVAMVLAAIWFFFIAKNGGFHFRKGDWEDYKSTVLRRKGPDGKTLSGATKTTVLGGGSVVGARNSDYDSYSDDRTQTEDMTEDGRSLAGTFAWAKKKVPPLRSKGLRGGGRATEQKPKGKKAQAQQQKKAQREIPKHKQPRGSKNNHDADMRAYRHEKPAQVGGLNRQTDATYSHHDFAYSDNTYSEMSESNVNPTGYNPFRDSVASAATTTSPTPHTPDHNNNNKHKRFNTSAASKLYTHSPNDSSGSHRPLRPHNHTSSPSPSRDSTPTRSGANRDRRRSSPHKQQDRGSRPGDYHPRRSNPPGSFTQTQYTEPIDFESRYGSKASDLGTEDSRGTKAYFHPIPGLGAGMGSAGHGYSAAAGGGGGGAGGGFRRSYGVGGRGRRDSLSDSEGETGTAFS